MPDTFTPNYNLTKPEVGASADTWGGKINSNLDTLDITVKTVETVAGAAQSSADAAQSAADAASAKFFPVGTRMVFHQASAPTGWVMVTTLNDRVLRVNSNNGGGIAGSWTISGIGMASAGAHGHTGDTAGHTLTTAQIPSHRHGLKSSISGSDTDDCRALSQSNIGIGGPEEGVGDAMGFIDTDNAGNVLVENIGGGGSHSHGIYSDGNHTHSITHSGGWRPLLTEVIIARYNG